MASPCEHVDPGDQTVPNGGETRREEEEDGGGGEGGGEEEGEGADVKNIQSHYLRCASPNLSMLSESRFSMISGSDADSIYMEPIHLSSAIAAKKIINEQLPPRGVRVDSVPESMLESAEQLMVEDLYNRVKDMIDDRSPYNTPCVMDIQRAMVQDRLEAPHNPVDEVWPNIFIAEKSVAVNKARLKRMGITHIINAAHGTGVYTGASFYAGIQYLGIEVDDFPDSDISPHFRTTAEFLDEALLTHKGKVLVDSMMGVSRSAVLVAAYLMIFHSMSIMEALGTLRKKRAICPNEGFLKQLREFNETLMEERDDDDDTLSQCSVIDARARARIFGEVEPEEDEDEDTDEDEEQSMVGVKAHSIMMEEEGDDTASLMSSVASSAAAAALKSGMIAARARAENPAGSTEVVGEELALPVSRESGGGEGGEEDEEEDGVGSMIREWQRRNEKYQSDEWWEAQLNSEAEGDDLDSLLGGKGAARSDADGGDLESITSEDVRAVKERVKRRNRHGPPSEAASTSSCTSYADLWKQRLREIEEQAAARYRKKDLEEESESDAGAPGGPGGAAHRRMDDEVASIMSDSSSMYNFCQKNKEKLTPLERWRVKRIQFGWNKKGEDGDGSSVVSGLSGASGETEARPSPSLEDVNMTAYQTWKLKQQKRLGEDGNKDEVLEMSRVVDDSGKAKRRQQRREEVMERSRKNLEESQSMCGGWESESCVSGGSAIPLSAFWAGAGVATGPPSVANNNDDNVSMLSGRSSNISSVSQARSVRSAHPAGPTPPICPILPVPTVMGPGGEPMVNLASIQNWIASVVSETLVQRQNEMMSLPPPSSAGSVLGYGGGGASSVVSGRGGDDRRSVLSGAPSYASDLSRARAAGGRAESVLSGSRFSSASSGVRSTLDSTSVASKKKQITTTSVPLFSLFQDQVDLKKLDSMEKEIKSEFRDKMATYEKKKILEDNKRSTLYKKKKPKEDEDEEEADERKRREEEFLEEAKKKVEKPKRSYGLSGCLNLSTALEKGKETNIDDWLRSVRPPPRKPTDGTEANPPEDPYYDDLDASASEFGFSNRRASYAIEEEEEEGYGGGRSRYRSSPEPLYRRTPLDAESPPSNGFSRGYGRAGRSYGALPDEGGEGTDGGYSDLSTKRKYGHLSRHHEEGTETEARPNRRVEAEADTEEEDVEAFIAQTRQRIRARALAEAEDDEVLSAWREQQETKSRSKSEES